MEMTTVAMVVAGLLILTILAGWFNHDRRRRMTAREREEEDRKMQSW